MAIHAHTYTHTIKKQSQTGKNTGYSLLSQKPNNNKNSIEMGKTYEQVHGNKNKYEKLKVTHKTYANKNYCEIQFSPNRWTKIQKFNSTL